jgi:hypothetical protein
MRLCSTTGNCSVAATAATAVVQESAVPAASPSSAFLTDAVNASGLGTATLPTYLRTVQPGEVSLATEASVWADDEALQSQGTGTGNPIPSFAAETAPSLTSALGSLAASQAGAAKPPTGAAPDRLLSGGLNLQYELSGAERPSLMQRTVSRGGTPRSGVEAAAMFEAEGGGVGPSTPSHRSHAAPAVGVQGPTATGTAQGQPGKKKKASEMSKAERRALQEEQRARKAAAMNSQGVHAAATTVLL